jgi:hypothetical protein
MPCVGVLKDKSYGIFLDQKYLFHKNPWVGLGLDPDSATAWICIRIQQSIWIRFSDSGYETLLFSPVLVSFFGLCEGNLHWFQCGFGSGSSILPQSRSGSRRCHRTLS